MLRPRPTTRRRLPGPAVGAILTAALTGLAAPGWSNTVRAVSWDHNAAANTILTIACSEPIDPASFRSYPVPDPPRTVVVLKDIGGPVEPDVLTIGDHNVERVRLGYKQDRSEPELHIVLDLRSDAVELLDLRLEGTRLYAELGVSPLAVATPTPAPSPSPMPPVTPSPTSSTLPTPTPSPAPTHTAAASPTPVPPVIVPAAAPPRLAAGDAESPPVSELGSAVAGSKPPPGTTVAEAERPSTGAIRVVDIAAGPRGDGSTLLRITADRRLPQGCARILEVDHDPPRIVLSIRGASAPDLRRSLDFEDANLDRVRLVHDAETSTGELHLVLQLSRSGVTASEMNQVGRHLVIRLTPPSSTPSTP